jgi:hypothetical protein
MSATARPPHRAASSSVSATSDAGSSSGHHSDRLPVNLHLVLTPSPALERGQVRQPLEQFKPINPGRPTL